MNYGPLEFAAYLRSKSKQARAARAARAAPAGGRELNQLTVVAGKTSLVRVARTEQVEAVSVYEAVLVRAANAPRSAGPVGVLVRPTPLPVVLVLSSHQTVQWQVTLAPGATLGAVFLSGCGESTVAGAAAAIVFSIGGFYAFKRGSAEFKHLENEVVRCTGRSIDGFQSHYAGDSFEIGAE